jgi:hypothetical protein
MATLADIFAVKLPDSAGEDSVSLLPLLKGEDKPVRDHAVSCSYKGVPGLRKGPWKYIPEPDPKSDAEVQLYNVSDDIAEKKNVAADHPEIVSEMRVLLEKIIVAGRSTPGPKQKNDIRVKRYPAAQPATGKKTAAKAP